MVASATDGLGSRVLHPYIITVSRQGSTVEDVGRFSQHSVKHFVTDHLFLQQGLQDLAHGPGHSFPCFSHMACPRWIEDSLNSSFSTESIDPLLIPFFNRFF